MSREIGSCGCQCVACGERYFGYDHHCDPKKIARLEARRAADRDDQLRQPTESTNLNYGFQLLHASGD